MSSPSSRAPPRRTASTRGWTTTAQRHNCGHVLGDSRALADIREADAAHARGDVLRGADAVRQLRS